MEHRYLLSQQNICNNHGFDKVVHHFMKKLLKNRTIRKLTSIAIGRRGNSISYIVIDTEQMQTFSLKLEIEKKSIHSVIVWYLFSVIWIRLIKRKKRRNINTKCKSHIISDSYDIILYWEDIMNSKINSHNCETHSEVSKMQSLKEYW